MTGPGIPLERSVGSQSELAISPQMWRFPKPVLDVYTHTYITQEKCKHIYINIYIYICLFVCLYACMYVWHCVVPRGPRASSKDISGQGCAILPCPKPYTLTSLCQSGNCITTSAEFVCTPYKRPPAV